jgi:hypothetical protein
MSERAAGRTVTNPSNACDNWFAEIVKDAVAQAVSTELV